MARTDQNSFLNRPANTLSDLVSQVKNDNKVADRYMRHFGMTKTEVVDMFSSLKIGRLPQDGVYLVYNVPGWEEVRSRALFFRKGTLVWTDQQGTPVMKVSCGNPMVRGSDIGVATVATGIRVQPNLAYRDLVMETPETSFIEATPSVAAPGNVEVNAADVLPTTPNVPQVSRSSFPYILPLGLGALFGFNNGSSPPVPEPCSMLVLGAGGAALVAARKRKKG
jgi:hypothetical protein